MDACPVVEAQHTDGTSIFPATSERSTQVQQEAITGMGFRIFRSRRICFELGMFLSVVAVIITVASDYQPVLSLAKIEAVPTEEG